MINMKHYLKLIISAGLLSGVAMTSCLEETFPTDGATSGQRKCRQSAFNAAIASYMNNMSLYGDGGDASDAGFSSFIIWRDAMTADFAIVNTPVTIISLIITSSCILETTEYRPHFGSVIII